MLNLSGVVPWKFLRYFLILRHSPWSSWKRFPRRNESKVGFLSGHCHCEPVRESRQCKMCQLRQFSRGISVPRKLVQSTSRWYKFQIPYTKLASPGNMWVFLTMKGSKASWKKDELFFLMVAIFLWGGWWDFNPTFLYYTREDCPTVWGV